MNATIKVDYPPRVAQRQAGRENQNVWQPTDAPLRDRCRGSPLAPGNSASTAVDTVQSAPRTKSDRVVRAQTAASGAQAAVPCEMRAIDNLLGACPDDLGAAVAIQMPFTAGMGTTSEAFAQAIGDAATPTLESLARRDCPPNHRILLFPELVGFSLVWQGIDVSKPKTLKDALQHAFWQCVKSGQALSVLKNVLCFIPGVARYGLSGVLLRALLKTRASTMLVAYCAAFGALARETGSYIVAGSIPLPPVCIDSDGRAHISPRAANRIYNTTFCFGPDGKIVGKTLKCHLTAFESFLDAASEEELSTFSTSMGEVGALICLDSFYPSCYRRLRHASPTGSVDILLSPSLMSPPACWYSRWDGQSPLPQNLPAELRADIGVLPEYQLWQKHAMLAHLPLLRGQNGPRALGVSTFAVGGWWDTEMCGQASTMLARSMGERAERLRATPSRMTPATLVQKADGHVNAVALSTMFRIPSRVKTSC